MKSKTVPYFSAYSCHCQMKFIYAPGLFSMQKGILIFLFRETLLKICCVYTVFRSEEGVHTAVDF